MGTEQRLDRLDILAVNLAVCLMIVIGIIIFQSWETDRRLDALELGRDFAIEAKRGAAEIVNPYKRGRDVNE